MGENLSSPDISESTLFINSSKVTLTIGGSTAMASKINPYKSNCPNSAVYPDLQGRISIIDIEAWTKDELREIPVKGFAELSAGISEADTLGFFPCFNTFVTFS